MSAMSQESMNNFRTLSCNIETELFERLDNLAKNTERTKTFYVRQALRRYISDVEEDFKGHSTKDSE